jgi:predicted transcriptional regulator
LKLLLRNIHIKEGSEINVMESIFVKEVIDRNYQKIPVTDNFAQTINVMIHGKRPLFPVVDNNENLKGIISIFEIKEQLLEKDSLRDIVIAGDIASQEYESVSMEENCQSVTDKMRRYDLEGLPVVDEQDPQKVIGMIWMRDIQEAYQKEIERREISSSLASKITMKGEETQVQFLEGYSISEISAPKSFVGKSIRELDIRNQYGVDVLSIKSKDSNDPRIKAIPSADYIITSKDKLVVAGEIRSINLLKTID